MTFDPGSDYQYGINTDLLARCVAAAAGAELDEVLGAAIFEPLRMSDTTFHLSDEQRSRLTPVHAKDETGSWIGTDVDYPQRPQPIPGGHGLYSTANDYLKFQPRAARRWRARRRPHPVERDRRRSVQQPDRRHRLPGRHPDSRPGVVGRLHVWMRNSRSRILSISG